MAVLGTKAPSSFVELFCQVGEGSYGSKTTLSDLEEATLFIAMRIASREFKFG